MPYLSCPSCRLTVYVVTGHSHAREECPRCGATLDPKRRRLFEPGPGPRDPRNRKVTKGKSP